MSGITRQVSLLVLVGAAALTGCGYSSSNLFHDDVRTVYVDMFETREFRRDLEFMLTEAVKKRVGLETPYRLASREQADTILQGELLEERQAAYAPDSRTRLPRDRSLTLAVRVQWKDQRSGKLLADRPVLIDTVDYLAPAGESEAFAQQKAIDRLARRIVDTMKRDDW